MRMKGILVIDDERPILDMLEISLASEGYTVLTAENGPEGLEIFRREKPKLVITDVKMPGMDGLEVLRRIRESGEEAEVIVITGHGDMDVAIAACQYGASDFITKPIRDEAMMLALKRAEEKLSIARKLKEYTGNLELAVQKRTEELRLAQEEVLQNERLATIGETVAGLAHYIKNILNGLRGGMYQMRSAMSKNEPQLLKEGWDMAQRNVEKVSQLVLDLLSYSKEREPQRRHYDFNAMVREVAESFRHRAEENGIQLSCLLDPNLKEAYLDPEGMHRVLLNLVTNAVEACTGDPDPSKSFQVVLKTGIGTDHRGREIFLFEITDNGSGMGPEVKERLFTRFFSTKKEKGTGLGLLITQKIIHEHGGEIFVESEEGAGSTFRLSVPHAKETGSMA
jgi:signal transduction histidine kinase